MNKYRIIKSELFDYPESPARNISTMTIYAENASKADSIAQKLNRARENHRTVYHYNRHNRPIFYRIAAADSFNTPGAKMLLHAAEFYFDKVENLDNEQIEIYPKYADYAEPEYFYSIPEFKERIQEEQARFIEMGYSPEEMPMIY